MRERQERARRRRGWVVAFAREGAQLSFFAGRLAFAGGGLVPRFLRVLGFVEAQTALILRQGCACAAAWAGLAGREPASTCAPP